MPSLWSHVRTGMTYNAWSIEDDNANAQEQRDRVFRKSGCVRAREVSIVRRAIGAFAAVSYLVWLPYLLRSPPDWPTAALTTVLLVAFPVLLKVFPAGPTNNFFLLLWFVGCVLAMDMATQFRSSIIGAYLSIVPVLSAVLGGGRLVLAGTLIAMIAFALCFMLAQVGPQERLYSQSTLIIIGNSLLELAAAVASTWLFARLIRRIDNLQTDSQEWSSMLARDVRTPLHGLVGQVETFPKHNLAARELESFEMTLGCTRMLQVVCDNMFEPAQGIIRPTEQPYRLRKLVGDVSGIAHAMASLRSQSVSVVLAPQSEHNDVCVHLSAFDVWQILGNLMSNAVKYSPLLSRLEVTLSLEEVGPERGNLMLVVEDSGPGVPQYLRKIIFDPFERGEAPSSVAGMGLGLSIVSQLVAAKKGRVECLDSTELRGAKFEVCLPCRILHRTASPKDSPSTKRNVGRVLIVDDNSLNLHVLCRFLVSLGTSRNDVVEAVSGESALDLLARDDRPFGVAFLDMVLPGIDGVELAYRLTSLHTRKFPNEPALVLVGVSASLTPSVSEAWTDVGVVKQLSKPFQRIDVRAALDFAQRQRQSTQPPANLIDASGPVRLAFAPPPGWPTPVASARRGLLKQLGKFDLIMWLRIVVFSFSNAATLNVRVKYMLMFFLGFALAYRWILDRHSDALRLAVIASVYFSMLVKSSLTGCGRFVGYAAIPIFAGLLFLDYSVYYLVGICCVSQIALVLLTEWLGFPLCSEVVNVSYFAVLQDSALITLVIATFIFISLSLVELADDVRHRWANTISHDLRAPLHGILAACRDIVESDKISRSIMIAVRTLTTCAISALGVADAVLGLAVERAPVADVVRLDELNSTVHDLAINVLGENYVEMADRQLMTHVVCDEPVLMYALSQFVAAPSLLMLRRARVRIRMSLDSAGAGRGVLVLSVEEAERPPALDAPELEFVDRESVVWGSQCFGSTLARIVEEFLGGSVIFMQDDSFPARQRGHGAWYLSVCIPLSLEPTPLDVSNVPLELSKLRVAVVDDARLSLRVFRRLMDKCGVEHVLEYWSSRTALRALAEGAFDDLDAAFLDLFLPGVDGFELASSIISHFKARRLRLPLLIACSADIRATTALRSEEAGMALRLPKPFSGNALRNMLIEVAKLRGQPTSDQPSSLKEPDSGPNRQR